MINKIEGKVYLLAMPSAAEKSGYSYSICSSEIDGFITVDTKEITMDVPDNFDIGSARIKSLKAEKSRIQAEAQLKAQNIEGQIQALLAIEHIK